MDLISQTGRRKLAHRLRVIANPMAPLWPVHTWVLRRARHIVVDGITIVDMNSDATDDRDFLRTMTEALYMIRKMDPTRYAIVRREIRYLVNSELVSWGMYDSPLKICNVDFGRLVASPGKHYPKHVAMYAGLIVHEATHGRLESLGFPYTRKTRVRIERICCSEQRRFIARLGISKRLVNELAPPFREENWHPTWFGSRVQLTRELFARIRQSREREAKARTRSRAA